MNVSSFTKIVIIKYCPIEIINGEYLYAENIWIALETELNPRFKLKISQVEKVNNNTIIIVKINIAASFARAVLILPFFDALIIFKNPEFFSCAKITVPIMIIIANIKIFTESYAK